MQSPVEGSKRLDYYGGALMIVLGLGASFQSLSYDRGTLSRMGPGFFPLALGIILTLTGVAIAAAAAPPAAKLGTTTDGETQQPWKPEWRGWTCIALGIVAFIVLANNGGLRPATFAVVFVSALGDRRNSVLSAAALAGATVVFAVVVFSLGLHVQLPLFHWG